MNVRSSFPRRSKMVPDELIVKLKPEIGRGLARDFAEDHGVQVVESFDMPEQLLDQFQGRLVRLKLPDGVGPEEAASALGSDERVAYAEPNLIFQLKYVSEESLPNDLDSELWGLDNSGQTGGKPGADVRAVEAWKIQKGDSSDDGPIIAVVDSGLDYTHPDLRDNLWRNPGEIPGDGKDNDGNGVVDDVFGYNAFSDTGDPMDGHSHGTHCTGTIAAVGNNGIGITGVMQRARVMGIKIFSDEGETNVGAVVRGLMYAAKMGADITSNSWGGRRHSQAVYDTFQAFDALHVVAAGNSGSDNDSSPHYPSNYDLDNLVVAAATDQDDKMPHYSQYGAQTVDVAAPGHEILSTVPGGKYEVNSGTSMAVPHVAGGAGLILSEYPDLEPVEIKNRLIYGSDRLEALHDKSVSDGRVNFASSLEDDRIAPAAPADFGLSHLDSRGGILSWTAVGDDKWCGEPAQTVDLKVSDSPINAGNFLQASSLAMSGAPEIGSRMHYTFGGPASEHPRTLHFAMRSVDNVGNASEISFATAVIPAVKPVFEETFESGSQSFSPSGDFHRTQVAERGTVFSSKPGKEGTKGDSELISPPIELKDAKNHWLTFEAKTGLFFGEQATVEVCQDGETWEKLAKLKLRGDWEAQGLDLSDYDGKTIRLKFRHAASNGNKGGMMMVDNVRLLAEMSSYKGLALSGEDIG